MDWKFALLGYVLVGLAIILFTRARSEVFGGLSAEERARNPLWMAVAFYSIVVPVAVVLWPLFLPSWFRKKESVLDALQRPAGEGGPGLKEIYEAMNSLAAEGCDTDEIPGATGEFGWDNSNPIPTHTTFGSTSYLARLRTPDGEHVSNDRIGSFGSPAAEMPVDGYELRDAGGNVLGVIYISPYHQRNSEKSPTGLVLAD